MVGIPEIVIPVQLAGRTHNLTAWFRDAGEDLVLFVHGLGCSKESFRAAWSRPELRGYSLLAIDLVGFGRSPRPPDFAYRMQDHARIVSSVIDAYALRRISLVAHSMGGTLSMFLKPRTTARLVDMVLVEPRFLRSSSTLAREIASLDADQFRADFLPRFRRRSLHDAVALFDAERADPDGFYRSACSMFESIGEGDLLSRFVHAQCSRVFVYGADNQHLAELQAIPASLQHAVADASHFVMQDNPDEFYSYVASRLGNAHHR